MASLSDLHLRRYPEPAGLTYRRGFVHNRFSNMDAIGHPVTYRGRTSRCLEFPFVAAKNPDARVPSWCGGHEVAFIDRVFGAPTPGHAKRLGGPRYRGGIIDPRPDWDQVCLAAMDSFQRQRWQPGTPDSGWLASQKAPLVEWNNWRDQRWGATVDSREGRNACGLLLDVIAAELATTGRLSPGAEEDFWRERQEELVAMLNALHPETIISPAPAPVQLGLFR